jgi:hypothetical protein
VMLFVFCVFRFNYLINAVMETYAKARRICSIQ